LSATILAAPVLDQKFLTVSTASAEPNVTTQAQPAAVVTVAQAIRMATMAIAQWTHATKKTVKVVQLTDAWAAVLAGNASTDMI
jgi:hypothetical protein